MKITKLLKGNHALAEGAIAAGCRYFYGYPITPQSELMERMSTAMPEAGGVFLQAESEVAAINMVIGSAASGKRVMTASSGPGMDLMQEGLGNIHAHQLPFVIADIMRAGPGDGALHPGQPDYTQAIKGGRADTRNITLAPWSVQEMYDLAIKAFDLADKYRNPVMILAESLLGQVYESLEIDDEIMVCEYEKKWAVSGAEGRARNLSIAHFPVVEGYNQWQRNLQEKYERIKKLEQKCEKININEKTKVVVISYGMVARNTYAAVKNLSEQGYPVGLFRPITLFPYPVDELNRIIASGVKLLVVEMSAGQMADDIKLQTGKMDITVKPGIAMGDIPMPDEIENWIKEIQLG